MVLFPLLVSKNQEPYKVAVLWNASSLFIQTCAWSIQNLLWKLKYNCTLTFWGSFSILLYHREIILLLEYMTTSFSLTCLHWFIIIYVPFLSLYFSVFLPPTADGNGYFLFVSPPDYNLPSFEMIALSFICFWILLWKCFLF